MRSDRESTAGAGAAFNLLEKRSSVSTGIRGPSVALSLLVIIAYACIVNYPCELWGLPSGDDRVVHLTYFHFFDEQLQTGEVYPRWISGLNFGAGSPIFFIQYPLPYYAAAGLRRAFHLPPTLEGQARAMGLFLMITGVLLGLFVWLWCRCLADSRGALLAALASLTLPYLYSCDIYTRVAIGEYSALAWAPLALFFCHQLKVRRAYAFAGISCAFAMVIFSNVLTAFLLAPFLVLYAFFCLESERVRSALLAAGAPALGAGLSSIYLAPMVANSRLFSMAHLVRFGPDIFFYKLHLFPYGQDLFPRGGIRFGLLDLWAWMLGLGTAVVLVMRMRRRRELFSNVLCGVAVVLLILICSAPLLSFAGFSGTQEIAGPRVIAVRSRVFLASFFTLEIALLAYASLRTRSKPLANLLTASCLISFFMATRWSDGIWRGLPFLWNVQFPWRFAGLLSIFAVGLLALALRDFENSQGVIPKPVFAALIALAVSFSIGGLFLFDTLGSYVRHYPPRVLSKLETMYPAYATLSRLPTSQELGANDGLTGGVRFLDGNGSATLTTIDARHLHLQANCLDPCTLVLKLVYYPLWHALDQSSQSVALLAAAERPGLTKLSLDPGIHEVELELPHTPPERFGAWMSMGSLIVVFLLLLLSRRGSSFGRPLSNSP
jgi:hypothetical protein